jgi:hypothetical protein
MQTPRIRLARDLAATPMDTATHQYAMRRDRILLEGIMRMTSMTIEGGCACGATRYSATSKPSGSLICHCLSCRRSAASPVVAWVTFSKDTFRFGGQQPSNFCSSPAVRRTFCSSCGTPLTYENAARALEIDVTTCSLDVPEAFPPTYHAWMEDDLSWVRFGDHLERHKQSNS